MKHVPSKSRQWTRLSLHLERLEKARAFVERKKVKSMYMSEPTTLKSPRQIRTRTSKFEATTTTSTQGHKKKRTAVMIRLSL